MTRRSWTTSAAGCSLKLANTSRALLCSTSPPSRVIATKNGRVRMAPTITLRNRSRSNNSAMCCDHFYGHTKSEKSDADEIDNLVWLTAGIVRDFGSRDSGLYDLENQGHRKAGRS